MTKDIEREAFEATQNPIVFERIVYIEKANLYTMKDDFRDDLFTVNKCNELNFGWSSWQAAKAHEAEKLKGCVVVPNDQIETWWQDAEEPENFETEAQNIHSIADGIDDGEIIEFHEHHTIHLPSSTLFGVWTYKEGKRVFITGTKAEVIEAARGGNEH
ncbi:MAG: hypothetical protein WBG77_09285 [Acinetobacter venetianus]|uniref:hypothetical protein n=1 Tax=Acinetobacter venetianus TaxID=52133 RepID=UPI003C72F103